MKNNWIEKRKKDKDFYIPILSDDDFLKRVMKNDDFLKRVMRTVKLQGKSKRWKYEE